MRFKTIKKSPSLDAAYEKFKSVMDITTVPQDGYIDNIHICAKDVFNEAWTRGVLWGFNERESKLHAQGVDRLNRTFGPAERDYLPKPRQHLGPLPERAISVSDLNEFINGFNSSYCAVFQHHLLTLSLLNEPEECAQCLANVDQFFFKLITVAWAHGWDDGVREGGRQSDNRFDLLGHPLMQMAYDRETPSLRDYYYKAFTAADKKAATQPAEMELFWKRFNESCESALAREEKKPNEVGSSAYDSAPPRQVNRMR